MTLKEAYTMVRSLKRLLIISLFLSIVLGGEAKVQGDSCPQEYVVGEKLGTCLVRGCTVFLGTVEKIGKADQEVGVEPTKAMTLISIDITISDWLYGKPEQASDKTTIVQAKKPSVSKTALGPWSIWEAVDIRLGGQLLIARWKPGADRPRWRNEPEDIALVLSDTSRLSRIREIIAQHMRLLAKPDEVKRSLDVLEHHGSCELAGYFVTYIMERDAVLDPNRAGLLLSDMITSALVPDSSRIEIADWIVSTFYRFSDS